MRVKLVGCRSYVLGSPTLRLRTESKLVHWFFGHRYRMNRLPCVQMYEMMNLRVGAEP